VIDTLGNARDWHANSLRAVVLLSLIVPAQVRFGEPSLQRMRSNGQAFKPAREPLRAACAPKTNDRTTTTFAEIATVSDRRYK
jgi:cytochrome c-type biogenesis protein CcmH/NrfG